MKSVVNARIFSLISIIVFVSLACQISAPTEILSTQTSITPEQPGTEISQTPASTLRPTDSPPTSTATTEAAPALSYTQLGGSGSQGLINFSGVSLEFDINNPGVLYARNESKAGYQSVDGGVTWQPIDRKSADPLNKQAQDAGVFDARRDPHNPTTIYGLNEATQGFAKSTDEGKNWTSFPAPFSGLIMSGDGIWEIDPRTPFTLFASAGGGIYKSIDGGETWRLIMEGLPEIRHMPFQEQRFIFDPLQPATLYFLDGPGGYGLYRSANGGDLWQKIDLPGMNTLGVLLDPRVPNTLYYASREGFYKSANAGQTWQSDRLGLPGEGIIQSLAIDPGSPDRWYAILQEGAGKLFTSENGGQAWNQVQIKEAGAAVPIRQIAVDSQTKDKLYASSQLFDVPGIFQSSDGGASWNSMALPQPNDPLYANGQVAFWALDPNTPATLYVGLTGTGAPTPTYVYKTTDAGATWTQIYQEYSLYNLVLSSRTPDTLYLIKNPGFTGSVNSRVVKSADGGQTWQEMGDLPANYSDYSDWLVLDLQDPGHLYIFLAGKGVLKSADSGGSWQPANFALPEGSSISTMIIDPQTPTVFYAIVSGEASGIFKSNDSGQTWNAVHSGVPEEQIGALALDPAHPATLYAAVLGHGVFRSVNSGETWSAVSPEPFTIPINTLVVDPMTPDTLFAGTGNGVWIIQPAGNDH